MRDQLTLVACVLFASACVIQGAPNSDGTITIANGSSYALAEVRVTDVDNPDWGPNLLYDMLYPEEQVTVSVDCGTYDVLVSDEYARDCVLGYVNLCYSDKVWTIDDATLWDCAF